MNALEPGARAFVPMAHGIVSFVVAAAGGSGHLQRTGEVPTWAGPGIDPAGGAA